MTEIKLKEDKDIKILRVYTDGKSLFRPVGWVGSAKKVVVFEEVLLTFHYRGFVQVPGVKRKNRDRILRFMMTDKFKERMSIPSDKLLNKMLKEI